MICKAQKNYRYKRKALYLFALVSFLLNCCENNSCKNLYEKANEYHQNGHFQNAMIFFDKAIKQNKACSNAYYGRGLLKEQFKDYNGAILDYKNAIMYNPDFFEAYNNLGNLKKEYDYPQSCK